MMISLKRNEAFKWYAKENAYTKGYIYDSGKTIRGLDLCDFFRKIIINNDVDRLKKINGCFSCVINFEDNTFLISDRIASFPLYYSTDGKYVSDSAEAIIDQMKGKVNIDQKNMIELIASSYITGEETVYKEIKIVDLGQYVKLSKDHVESKYYFRHIHNYDKSIDDKKLKKIYQEKNNKIFENLISSLDGKTAVVPLSGGYDSRYIACMLKKKNYNNVICYTYGDKETYEVQYSKIVAEKLGYKWYFIEYNQKEWENIFNDEFLKYCNYAHNYISIPHIQDYIALKVLKEKKVIDNKCIIVNGFCGDLPAGSFLLDLSDEKFVNLDLDWIVNYIYKQNYRHIKIKEKYEKTIKNKIKQHINNLNIKTDDFKNFMKIYEEWFTGARPCKWVVNSNRLYEFFGIEWRMPLWDNEFIDFFYNLDYENRIGCKFYKKYIFEELFVPYKVDLKKPEFTNKKTLKYEKSLKKIAKKIILRILNFVRIITNKNIIKWHDINNYSVFSLILSKKIKNKKIINYQSINAHQMMAIWWCETKYGIKTIKSIWRGSKKNEN